ncbi:MAG: NAD(P)/FAD-dependent oxidoreductase [Myxococcota bacterium]
MQTLVVGAGVVGLAITQRLARAGVEVVCVDAAGRAGQGVTARNSGVLHAGLYYPRESLKARLCVAGNAMLGRFCAAHDVPMRRVGKLLVATTAAEEPELERLWRQGQENGVTGLRLVDAAEARRLEPNVSATAGLLSAATGIIDVPALCAALERSGRDAGATFAWRHRVLGGARRAGRWVVDVEGPDGQRFTLEADEVVLAGGLHADTLARSFGVDVEARRLVQHWVKGRYCRVTGGHPVSRLIYPVPAPQLAGLGVHLTLELEGGVRLGPDVEALVERVERYDVPEQVCETFHAAAVRYLPWLERRHLQVDTAGIRPKLSRPGEPFRDFEVLHEPEGLRVVIGLESPGLTASLALAEHVAAPG